MLRLFVVAVVNCFYKSSMMRRRILKFLASRKGLPCVLVTLAALYASWRWSHVVGQALLPPPPPDQNLEQFRCNRTLQHYFDNINLLIEPSSTCELKEVPVLVMVTSAPSHWQQRDAIRSTWGKHQQTYFFLGLGADDDQLVDTYIEAKQHSDLVVHEYQDHYQNLTLKVALMMQWTLKRCPLAHHVFKTDDDVLVNPWTLRAVLDDNKETALLGYKKENSAPHRDEYTKWYLPRWLFPEDVIPEYLSGTGYIIKGKHLEDIITAALKVPLINMEDIYFTYLVAKKTLGLNLTHDRRLSPYKPWVSLACPYWSLASIHSLTPAEVVRIWPTIEEIGQSSSEGCGMFKIFSSDLFLL